jgi:hypothetical protein
MLSPGEPHVLSGFQKIGQDWHEANLFSISSLLTLRPAKEPKMAGSAAVIRLRQALIEEKSP